MSGALRTHEPDHLYCVYCHAVAIGPCATCKALICADCAVLTGGSVARAAVCERCHARGRGGVRPDHWWGLLRLPLLLIGALAALVLLLRWLTA